MTEAAPDKKAVLLQLRAGSAVHVPLTAFPGETMLARKQHAEWFRKALRLAASYHSLRLCTQYLLNEEAWVLAISVRGAA